jgi:hypothetical protein
MNSINEYKLMPGVYQHYKGGMYVVTELVTHLEGADGVMQPLPDPLVCYRDLDTTKEHKVYARPLSVFTAIVPHNDKTVATFAWQTPKRFTLQ